MGWEYRGNRLYYYHKKREGKRVVSEYVGVGTTAYLVSLLDQEDRSERAFHSSEWKNQLNKLKKDDNDLKQLQKSITGVVRAFFLTSGYHPHKGQWRRIRNG